MVLPAKCLEENGRGGEQSGGRTVVEENNLEESGFGEEKFGVERPWRRIVWRCIVQGRERTVERSWMADARRRTVPGMRVMAGRGGGGDGGRGGGEKGEGRSGRVLFWKPKSEDERSVES